MPNGQPQDCASHDQKRAWLHEGGGGARFGCDSSREPVSRKWSACAIVYSTCVVLGAWLSYLQLVEMNQSTE